MADEQDLFIAARQAAAVLNQMLQDNDEVTAEVEGERGTRKITKVRAEGPYLIVSSVTDAFWIGDAIEHTDLIGTVQDLKIRFQAKRTEKKPAKPQPGEPQPDLEYVPEPKDDDIPF